MGSGVTCHLYHMRTFTFFLAGTGETQRNISEVLVLFFFFFSLQIDIFLKSRLEIWHGNNVVQKISLLLPFKQITNVLTYSFFYFIFSVSPF